MNATLVSSHDLNAGRPSIAPESHPVIHKQYTITTPPIEAFISEVIGLIKDCFPGGMFWAPPRTGKSRALEMLQLEIDAVFPGMPVVYYEAWAYPTVSQGPFMEDLLKAIGHVIVKKGDPNDKRDRFVEKAAERAIEHGKGRIVLLIDEAQLLDERHFLWLIGIHNLLYRHGVTLMTFLMGQHQLVYQRAAFLKTKKKNIVGRFMTQVVPFHGVVTEADLAGSLNAYDEEEYPENSGWSYSRFWAPALFASGWRLSKMAPALWASFHAVRSLAKNPPSEIEMQYVCRAAEHVLLNVRTADLADAEAVRVLMDTAIAVARYPDVLIGDLE